MTKILPWVLAAAFTGAAAATDKMPLKYDPAAPDRFTVERLAREVPEPNRQFDAEVLPLRLFNLLPAAIYFQLQQLWRGNGLGDDPEAIIISRGYVSLEDLSRKLDNPAWIEQTSTREYLIKRPIYIAHGSALVIRDQSARLSLKHGAFVAYHGNFYLQDSQLTTWDAARGDYGPRPELDKKEALILGKQALRPFLLGMEGSHTHLVASHIRGLGYMSRPSALGIAISRTQNQAPMDKFSYRGFISQLPNPTGTVVGNSILDLMFGFFTNQAGEIALVGNLIYDSVVYNIDPHDYTRGLLIARNVSARAKLKHGIIISREVDDAVIAENVVFNNQGAGIMVDRNSDRARILGNLVLENGGEGISVLESSDSVIRNNHVSRNLENGLFTRNSRNALIAENQFIENGANGVELVIYDVNTHKTRNVDKDPFDMTGSAVLRTNLLDGNFRAAISSKGVSDVQLEANRIGSDNGLLFGGDLYPETEKWLRRNARGAPEP